VTMPDQYRIGDFPTYCPVCGFSYWGSYHDCPGTYTPPPPAYYPTPTTTVDGTLMLSLAINRLAAALEALVARYDVAREDDEDEER